MYKQFKETDYLVSDLGVFKDSKDNFLPILKDKYSNKVVALLIDNKVVIQRVDKAVAQTFLSNPKNLDAITHKDHKKYNCKANNLEWFDRSNLKQEKKGYI